jgi:hypothetical protein
VGQGRYAHPEFAADLTPRGYLILCMIPDDKDGEPHFTHGIVRRVHVG